MVKILCVEDSAEVIEVLTVTLEHYQLTFVETVKKAIDLLGHYVFDLILLDINLPDGNGFEILAYLHERTDVPPIFCLTGMKDFGSKVSAFTLGADDFIQKPFDPRELKLRVETKLRKLQSKKQTEFLVQLGDLLCSVEEQRLWSKVNNKQIDLTSYEFRIFSLLAKTPNRIFSRDEILNRVWGECLSVVDRAVDVHVSNLRRKISGTGVMIETVIGAGYRMVLVEGRSTHKTKTSS